MASPLWKYPGRLEGRIEPIYSVPQSGTAGYYYYYSSYAYGYTEENVFCLGEDQRPFQDHRLLVGDTVSVEQAFTITAAHKLLLFSWHMRMPDMPASRGIVTGAQVDFVDGLGLISPGDGCVGVVIKDPDGASSMFSSADTEQRLLVDGGAHANNIGTFRISGVPWDQGDVGSTVNKPNGSVAIIENSALVAETANNVTLRVLGLNWIARAYADWGGGFVERVVLSERYDHTWYRTGLALHVSKHVGPLTIKFEMQLGALP